MIAGQDGLTAAATASAQSRLPGSSRHVLADYDAPGWADVVADRTNEILQILLNLPALSPVTLPLGKGTHAGITYAIHGNGPPLVLLPFFLAPSQWDPVITALITCFTVIVLGGRYLGGIAALEDRAAVPSYRALARLLWDTMEIGADDSVLDVGCGSGALDRLLAPRLADGRIVATDINRFLLREAALLAEAEQLSGSDFVPISKCRAVAI